MTREERLAAGWRIGWLVKAHSSGCYSVGKPVNDIGLWTDKLAEAHAFPSLRSAFDWILAFDLGHGNAEDLYIKRIWRRKKPKASPPLKVGDTATITFKIIATDPKLPIFRLEYDSDWSGSVRFWVYERELVK